MREHVDIQKSQSVIITAGHGNGCFILENMNVGVQVSQPVTPSSSLGKCVCVCACSVQGA